MPSDAAMQQVWAVSLAIYLAVVAVVAVLLTMILMTARRIREGTAAIWAVGQKVANNTIQIALLVQTNHLVSQILSGAAKTAAAVQAVEEHARQCPHCPDCVTGR
ncbi:MAG: hypothetical protein ACM4AI_10605 [Acidobacteriota bacterium]